jgi:hypothetical protein
VIPREIGERVDHRLEVGKFASPAPHCGAVAPEGRSSSAANAGHAISAGARCTSSTRAGLG